jgi:hypothetical protein
VVKETKRERERWERRAEILRHEFGKCSRGALTAAVRLAEHEKKRPEGETFMATGEFKDAIREITKFLSRLEKAEPGNV